MMVYKRITTKKTNTGYSIHVFVEDGNHVKPLIACITRYFEWVGEHQEGGYRQRIIDETDEEINQLKGVEVLTPK